MKPEMASDGIQLTDVIEVVTVRIAI